VATWAPSRNERTDVTEEPQPKRTWTLQEGVAYETALEVLAQLIAVAGRRISAAGSDDAEETARWETMRADWTARRLALSPTDTTAVQAVLTRDAAVLRQES
jgi:hypothetical protein